MKLHDLYKHGFITFEGYFCRLMKKFDAAIKAADKKLKEMESRNV